jgi:hypothetical protein
MNADETITSFVRRWARRKNERPSAIEQALQSRNEILTRDVPNNLHSPASQQEQGLANSSNQNFDPRMQLQQKSVAAEQQEVFVDESGAPQPRNKESKWDWTTKAWEGQLGLELLWAVDRLKKDTEISLAGAVEILTKSAPWREYERAELEARYQEAKKYWAVS